ncbi:MAG: geranylgeranyl reductase family protein [Burkholderiales bacterium]|nr:geranylgeranyl reductase family protein [Burkholderiales bacterium]
MTKLYDLIIIGAGPSGTSCAYNIKRLNPGARVLLLDKAEFPRYKPCGGGVSPEVANYLDFDLKPAIDSVCDTVVMVANGQEITADKYPLWMVRREKFDNYLLSKVKDKGVEFKHSVEVQDIITTNETPTVITSIGEFQAKIVIIAEGGRGKLAKKLGYAAKNTILAAMEYEHYTAESDGKLYIDFDYNDSGYAWNFPKSDGLSLGIGGFVKGKEKGKVGLPHKLLNYTKQFSVNELDKKNLHGHPILLYSGRQKLVHNRVMLIGEIAGCVDPLTAEGIRPAIKSGFLAAKVINYALAKNDFKSLVNYDLAFHKEIGSDFYYARIMSYFLNKNLKRVLPMLTSARAVNAFMSVFSGKSTYHEKINWRRIGKLIWKSIF